MEMPKPSAKMVDLFESVAPGGPQAEQRKMFGQPAAFVHGNMFMGLYGDVFQVRLSEPDRKALIEAGGTPFTVMGRAMKDYVEVPEAQARRNSCGSFCGTPQNHNDAKLLTR